MDPRQPRRVGVASDSWVVAQFQPDGGRCDPRGFWVLESTQGQRQPASKDTDAILEGMTYVGGMNYAKYRLEACPAKTSGKQKMRHPALCVQDELTRENASSYRDGTVSTTSSRSSSAYRVVEEAAAARTAMLQAEAEAQRALARLTDTRAECNEQHKVMTAELGAMQVSVKCSLRTATQQTTVQAAKVDAMGYRLEEMKNLLLQRELRMKYKWLSSVIRCAF